MQKKSSKQLTVRLLQIHACLPADGSKRETREFHADVIRKLGRARSLRTTQRDLNSLKAADAADFEVCGNGHDWFRKNVVIQLKQIGQLNATQAINLMLLLEHGARFGMKAQVDELAEIKDYAERVLLETTADQHWSSKRLTSTTRFIALEPALIDQRALKQVQDSLLKGYAIRLSYRIPERGDLIVKYLVRTLGLSFQDANIYLSCYVQEETWPHEQEPQPGQSRHKYESRGPGTMSVLQMHRISKVEEAVARPFEVPPDYDVNSMDVMHDLRSLISPSPIELHLRLSPNLRKRLSENPLVSDQVIQPDGTDHWLFKGRIHDGQGLRLWLLSNADQIEVLAPLDLRRYMRDTLTKAACVYALDPT